MPALAPVNPLTEPDLLAALEVVAARVPDRHVTPDVGMAAAWYSDLRGYDRLVVHQAARSWSGLRFPSALEFRQHVQEEYARAADVERRSSPTTTTACPVCGTEGGGGFFELLDFDEDNVSHPVSDQGTYRPCHACNVKAYERWKGGHMETGHDCAECRDIRRGKGLVAATKA